MKIKRLNYDKLSKARIAQKTFKKKYGYEPKIFYIKSKKFFTLVIPKHLKKLR